MHGRTLVSVLATLMVCALGWAAVAATHTVDAGGGGDFLTIQAAIDAAASGDTILIEPGIYPEDLNVWQSVTIQGFDPAMVTIMAAGLPGHNGSGIYVSANDVHLSGFTLIGTTATSAPRYGIKFGTVSGGSVSDIIVQDMYRSGFDFLGTSNTTVTNVMSINNGGHGISLCDANNIVLSDITVAANGWQGVSVVTWGRYAPIGTSGIVFTGTNTFLDLFQLEQGRYPAGPPEPITFSTDLADGADVTVQAGDFAYAVWGDDDQYPLYQRVYFVPTLATAQAVVATPGSVGHMLPTGRYIQSLVDQTQLYATPGGSIRAAAAAAGDEYTIHVDPAVYQEQIVVNADADLIATAPGAIVLSPGTMDDFQFPESGAWWEPIILLYGGTADPSGIVAGTEVIEANVTGLTVDGDDRVPTPGRRAVGIMLRNVDGTVQGNTVGNMHINGAQTFGIYILGDSTVSILNNNVSGYARGGIGANGDLGPLPDPDALIEGNTVTGPGMGVPVTWAPNGIQIGWGATGTIRGNSVSGNGWPGSAWSGSGIILAGSLDVLVEGNTVFDNETGIATIGDLWWGSGSTTTNTVIQGNDILGNVYGISLQDGTHNTLIQLNVISGNQDGIDVCDFGVDAPTGTVIRYNSIAGNNPAGDPWWGGVWVDDAHVGVDAALNWWGSSEGPDADWDSDGVIDYFGGGDVAIGSIIFSPWLGSDPDSDPGTPGVQLVDPMLIIVAPIGPEPTAGYLNAAIAGSNELPAADTIEVRHGTYDASEPIADSVEIVSEVGSATNTLLNGPIAIDVPDVLLGRWKQGFTVNGPITVGAGVDASTVHINWNDLYGLVTNNGLNTLDATFNYWGEDGPDTVGSVNVFPLLPEGSDIIIGYMEDHELNALEAIDFSHFLDELNKAKRALVGIDLMNTFGLSFEEALELIDEFGWMHVRNALRKCGGDFDRFMILLVGYGIGGPAGGGGSFLGGGAAGTLGISSYCVGCEIPLMLELLHPVTGEIVDDATVSFSVCRTLEDGTAEIVLFGVVPFDPALGAYAVNVETDTLEPGFYDIYLGSDDGRSQHFQVEIFE